VAEENVIAENKGGRLPFDEFGADDERLRETLGLWLWRI
jgi:hypothetical protein